MKNKPKNELELKQNIYLLNEYVNNNLVDESNSNTEI